MKLVDVKGASCFDVERKRTTLVRIFQKDSVEFDITNSLKLAAALSVPVERRSTDWGAYTNGLPAQVIQILLE